jgi:TPP-dependent pyruvate/acetoin dehydrogenase alpha subunit
MNVGSVVTLESNLVDMVALVAAIDQRLTRMSQDGQIPPHQPCKGETATLVGAVAAMEDSDWIFWGRQVCVAALWRGLSMEALFTQILGGGGEAQVAALKVVTVSAGPATRLPHAVGLAWAAREDAVVALCELGDGAVSDGDFHVGLNFAAVLNAPVVFVVRSAAQIPVAERAEGYGIREMLVDGMDVEAVRKSVAKAAHLARNGQGPTLIEARVNREHSLGKNLISRHEGAVSGALNRARRALAGKEAR